MNEKITDKQAAYLLTLINRKAGKSYRFLSQVQEDGIGKQSSKVRGITKAEASTLIDQWSK